MVIFSTWTTYGTWLRGDARGWYLRKVGERMPNLPLFHQDTSDLKESPCFFDQIKRVLVTETILEHCTIRKWECLAMTCQTNHVHVLIATPELSKSQPRNQFKAWCTRRLRESFPDRETWWTDRGWDDVIEDDLHEANVRNYIESHSGSIMP
jgi:REP element-mobilizing transposase RayT